MLVDPSFPPSLPSRRKQRLPGAFYHFFFTLPSFSSFSRTWRAGQRGDGLGGPTSQLEHQLCLVWWAHDLKLRRRLNVTYLDT